VKRVKISARRSIFTFAWAMSSVRECLRCYKKARAEFGAHRMISLVLWDDHATLLHDHSLLS